MIWISQTPAVLTETIRELKLEKGEDVNKMFSDPRYIFLSKCIKEDYKIGSN